MREKRGSMLVKDISSEGRSEETPEEVEETSKINEAARLEEHVAGDSGRWER